MFRKYYFNLVSIALVTLAFGATAFGQTAPVRGEVKLKKQDGTVVPFANATVEAYRTDIDKGKMPAAKTNKKGEFNFVGFQLGQTYALAVSGEGIGPEIYPNIKAGRDDIVIEVREGDGKQWTEEEVRRALKAAAANPGGGEMTAAQKKEQDELKRKNDEIIKQNEKARDTNKIVNAALKDGSAAFQAQNYDLAIAKFDEGYMADPEFEGSAPVFLTSKGLVLRERGIAGFRLAASGDASAKAAAFDKAKADFAQAIDALEKSLAILEKAPAGDASVQAGIAKNKIDALKNYVILHGAMAKMRLDPAKTQESVPILDRYIAAERDDQKKLPIIMNWANYMREAGETKNAIHAYRIILEKSPDNIDAMAGIGLSLFAEGVGAVPENKEEMQEGLNFMQKFADTAPDTHPLKASVKESVDYLKNTAKLAPQKVTTTKKKN